MKVDTTYSRNPLLGWDINVKINAEHGEQIILVQIDVNDFNVVQEEVPSAQSWQRQLTQEGAFPGDNKVTVTVTDNHGANNVAITEW